MGGVRGHLSGAGSPSMLCLRDQTLVIRLSGNVQSYAHQAILPAQSHVFLYHVESKSLKIHISITFLL